MEIILGGGCFWCLDASFKLIKGINSVEVRYSGGDLTTPSYDDVCSGQSGHAEVVKINFDSNIIKLENILDVFFDIHDATTLNRQGNDIGTQYRSVVFYNTDNEKNIIENYIKNKQFEYSAKIVTEVEKLNVFYKAEEYHQSYFEKNPNQAYCQIVIKPKLDKIIKNLNKYNE